MEISQLKYVLALRQLNGVGDKLAQRILLSFNSPEEVFRSSKRKFLNIKGGNLDIYNQIKNFNKWDLINYQINRYKNFGFKIITFLDDEYPKSLLNIFDPPTVLYCFGELKDIDEYSISIVGSRNGDHYGRSVTKSLTQGLVEIGVTIVSGMARGIDTFAHNEAINNGGRTIAVLGCGLNEIYPRENSKLYKKIPENGAVISEFPIGIKPEPQNFPKRNRIISGIALGVVVVQASRKSGSLITADFALQQNREVFAVPGNINGKLNEGTNQLIKNGAKLVQNVDDIISEIDCLRKIEKKNQLEKNVKFINSLNEYEKNILNLISLNPLNIDELTEKTKMDNNKMFKLLLDMELKGLIEHLPGNIYQAR